MIEPEFIFFEMEKKCFFEIPLNLINLSFAKAQKDPIPLMWELPRYYRDGHVNVLNNPCQQAYSSLNNKNFQ